VLFGALLGLAALVRGQAALGGAESIRAGQLIRRYPQSVLTALAFIGASLGLGGVRLALGNRAMGWLAAISYQFYMWHQVIALQLKNWRFPPSVSENPHMTGERSWQITYLLLSLGLSVLVSALVTFFIEQPLAKRGGRLKGQGGRKDDRPAG
jgi:peptidoglycan/LPS O-acetylase OafA/YrhL